MAVDARGFTLFGTLEDRYGASVRVKESSDIEGNVWVFVDGGSITDNDGAALLSPAQARKLARLLLEGADFIEASLTRPEGDS